MHRDRMIEACRPLLRRNNQNSRAWGGMLVFGWRIDGVGWWWWWDGCDWRHMVCVSSLNISSVRVVLYRVYWRGYIPAYWTGIGYLVPMGVCATEQCVSKGIDTHER